MQTILPFPDIAPEIFSIDLGGFTLALRWYALAYIVGILAGWRLAIMAVRRPALWPGGTAPFTMEAIDDLMTSVILGIIIGGRLGFVLFYQPGYYLANPAEIAMIWQGGMSFHGGMLGVAAAGLYFAWRRAVPLASVLDIMALATPPGLLLGRIANFINAELWGRPTDLPWGVVFPGIRAQDCPGIEGPCARHPSQLYEAGLEGIILGIALIILVFGRGWLRRPGQITGVFLIGYGLSRFAVEFVRQADPQFITETNPLGHVIGLGGTGLSMGQLLSLPMIAIGIGFVIWARRRPVPA
ncbi:prolipoprotein diacylglyceryl transferase [Profundibacterium mesophilum]|uniref:Phosphatidylglycerol--prolipoprotein diacylglyceryl transferase n=1 Tax=Profundibacterium mesophilum KAUST100406-0324 TaxID=1037889 RepID=A0A921TCU9_9RHOB|nr:prolipoprotein diacylglyceryl transferase [Profundibacterium mesophilum]KAF0675357.1 Prolipoprotein diacylglyceryl transferase [Profundibacterium mesophilum KAUST100406-0324]